MRRPASLLIFGLAAVGGLVLATNRGVAAQGQAPVQVPGRPMIARAVHADRSRPLRDIPPKHDTGPRREIPVGHIPPPFAAGPAQDPVQQSFAVTGLAVTGTTGFPGVGVSSGFSVQYAPPDINGAAGNNYYVQWVNTSFAVFNKTGTEVYGPAAGNTLWSGFGGGCENNNDGDPIAQYDKAAQRWVMTQFSVSAKPYLQCVAVSTTDDPTGTWNRYAFEYSAFPDYPKLGVWPDGYYMSFNMFGGNKFNGSLVCAYDRTAMLNGDPASQVCFQFGSSVGGLLPSDLDGSTPPPVGAPNAFVNFGSNSLNLYRFHVDWANPGNSTLTGPISISGVQHFTPACNGSGGTCVPQPGTSQLLDTIGDRLMYRLAYRNFGDHDALVVNHSVTTNDGRTGVRWYEIRDVGSSPTVFQQGTYAPKDGLWRWMGSIAQDHDGNIALGFSVSSSSTYPSIRFAGHDEVNDRNGTLSISQNVIAGSGSQSYFPFGLSRWGDYSDMSIDPTDDCTFWYTNEYLTKDGGFNWSTWINTFKFDSCSSTTASPDFTIAASPSSGTVTAGGSTSYTVNVSALNGFNDKVNLSATGLPAGATASFSPTSITGSGSSTLTVYTSASTTPPDTYTLTITGTDTSGAPSHATTVTLVVQAAPAPDFTIAASPSSLTVTAGGSTSYGVTITSLNLFGDDVNLAVSGLPSGAGGSFSPNPVPGGQGPSTLSVLTSSSTPAGTYTLTITGTDTSGSPSHATTVSLVVQAASSGSGDFTISISPGRRNVKAGDTASYTVTIGSTGGFTGDVSLTADSPGAVSLSPASVTGGSGTATLAIDTTGLSKGTYTVTVTGTSGSLVHSTSATVRIR